MSVRPNSCPVCNQQLEFFGIAHHKVFGRRLPVHVKWFQCQSPTCGMMSATNFRTRVLHTRKPFTSRELDQLFPTTREKRERGGPRKVAANA